MEAVGTLFAAIDYRDPMWIGVAYLFGFVVWQLGLPPLVGFLLAGFLLNMLGAAGGDFLHEMADLGVTLLLFSIGLKLNVRQLLRPEVWGVATAHMGVVSVGIATILWLLAGFGIPLLAGLTPSTALLVGFALSFSSTVFAVKVFEEHGELGSHYGRVAIGVLIVQDIAAVVFLAASTAKLPSPWAAAIIMALIVSKPLLLALLKRAGHGELLILFGLVLALGGSAIFEAVGLKGDLGALFFGVLLAQHPKAGELAKSLLSLKDLFLVGFFLSVGMAVTPSLDALVLASLLLLLVSLKALLFFLLFTRFRMRIRPATLASLSLANFSEFGLIVVSIALTHQWLTEIWLVATALAVVLSFILASPLNAYHSEIYVWLRPWLHKLEHAKRLQGDETIHLGDTRALVCGMGRIGTGAYEYLQGIYGEHVLGLDFDEDKASAHQEEGRRALQGDSSNPDFWSRVESAGHKLEMALLCMPNHKANLKSAKALRAWGFTGHIAAAIKYPEEEPSLHTAGVDSTFSIFVGAGNDFARKAVISFRTDTGKGQ